MQYRAMSGLWAWKACCVCWDYRDPHTRSLAGKQRGQKQSSNVIQWAAATVQCSLCAVVGKQGIASVLMAGLYN